MRINDITLEVCVSGLGEYKFKSNDIKNEIILDINRYKKIYTSFFIGQTNGLYIETRYSKYSINNKAYEQTNQGKRMETYNPN